MEADQAATPEPALDLVRSAVLRGQRFRPVSDTIHVRPAEESFDEFLIEFVKWTLGKVWWRHELAKPDAQRHCVVRWTAAFASVTQREPVETVTTEHGTRFATECSGPVRALVSLGYDLYCMRAKGNLPEGLIERLRERRGFQAARHEIATAAIIARAGLWPDFLIDAEWQSKHCEFIAVHRETGLRVAVEAKSRERDGVLHRNGGFSYDGDDSRGLIKLLRKSLKQGLSLPLIVFLDLNLPPSAKGDADKAMWARDFAALSARLNQPTQDEDQASPCSLLVATNFGFHFGAVDGNQAPIEIGAAVPAQPRAPLPPQILNAVIESTCRYGKVPVEV